MSTIESQTALSEEAIEKTKIRRVIGAFLLILLLFAGYKLMFRRGEILKGIYTIAHAVAINEHEGKIPGMQYQYMNLTYTGKLTMDAESKVDSNKEFLVILIDGDPNKPHIIGSLPDYFINVDAPPSGWKELPTCK